MASISVRARPEPGRRPERRARGREPRHRRDLRLRVAVGGPARSRAGAQPGRAGRLDQLRRPTRGLRRQRPIPRDRARNLLRRARRVPEGGSRKRQRRVSFTPKSPQMFLPFLITDPSSASPPPTMTDFFTCLTGPAEAHPFTENGFIINPALSFTLSGAEKLSFGPNWSWLVMRLQSMSFLFASQPVGGVRVGIVPNDRTYPWTGMALPRTGAPPPAFIVVAADARWFTHELGHASGLLHVNCGAAGPYGGLPLTISDPGLDVFTRTLVPAGSQEAMGTAEPPWPSDRALGTHVQLGSICMRALTFAAVLQNGKLELQPGFVTDGEPSHERGELRVEALERRRPLATTAAPAALAVRISRR